MASSPSISMPLVPGEQLSREQAWELYKSLFGSMHDSYERSGGVEVVIRDMRREEERP